jgi:hypothetical protein
MILCMFYIICCAWRQFELYALFRSSCIFWVASAVSKTIEKGREEQWKSTPRATSLFWGFAAGKWEREKLDKRDTKPRNKILLHIWLAARSVHQKNQ